MQVAEGFPRHSDQIPRARALVRSTLEAWGVGSAADDVVLTASELFTNAVLHGEGRIELRLELRPATVRVEVVDEGSNGVPAAMAPASAGVFSGRGLAIVEKLARTWGSGRAPHGGTRVWAEVPRSR
jgi:anti-sigma regulatory factor (Ser/Thr protein kinase)